ncbi:hypothetical protein TL16_g10805 [Triparma laevis f. inornata]|uniref:Uncharacterized protein n=2 Tax=Triparma laevis TaxID=1534972 RepID=A0A9W7B1J0_9STRA|nr:hypothetical protein TrLO_g11830 [Triparma laevis f. longispina]GMH87288.1 hypothetical protein TL16_g10805 [Triparma laevis f. inornata]
MSSYFNRRVLKRVVLATSVISVGYYAYKWYNGDDEEGLIEEEEKQVISAASPTPTSTHLNRAQINKLLHLSTLTSSRLTPLLPLISLSPKPIIVSLRKNGLKEDWEELKFRVINLCILSSIQKSFLITLCDLLTPRVRLTADLEGMCKGVIGEGYWEGWEGRKVVEEEFGGMEMTPREENQGLKLIPLSTLLPSLTRTFTRLAPIILHSNLQNNLSNLPISPPCSELILTTYFFDRLKEGYESVCIGLKEFLEKEIKDDMAMPMIVSTFKRYKHENKGGRREEIVKWGWQEGVIHED